jgi:hypothetical protein
MQNSDLWNQENIIDKNYNQETPILSLESICEIDKKPDWNFKFYGNIIFRHRICSNILDIAVQYNDIDIIHKSIYVSGQGVFDVKLISTDYVVSVLYVNGTPKLMVINLKDLSYYYINNKVTLNHIIGIIGDFLYCFFIEDSTYFIGKYNFITKEYIEVIKLPTDIRQIYILSIFLYQGKLIFEIFRQGYIYFTYDMKSPICCLGDNITEPYINEEHVVFQVLPDKNFMYSHDSKLLKIVSFDHKKEFIVSNYENEYVIIIWTFYRKKYYKYRIVKSSGPKNGKKRV